MPYYTIRSKKTGKSTGQRYMTFEELDIWEKENPTLEVAIGAPLIHSGAGLKKPDAGFRDLLKTIKRGNSKGMTKSTVNDF